ncbi:hypothetical protein [Bacillus thuringiensis]|uniref:hypothetical protein n=1 Tax=Bacillus thuringiensis TaxID=1428 RepID=UPI000A39134F|nr:hypothetical protein [Bacillus thuringiensis]OTZ47901.1 hypothetical protein BK762_19655 [Bacillus thuringiensis serovar toumanoffi]
MNSNTGQLYKVKGYGAMVDMLEDKLDIPDDIKEQFTEYDMYEKVSETSVTMTVWHMQLDVALTFSLSDFYSMFKPYNTKEVILRPVATHTEIIKYLKNEFDLDEITYDTGVIVKVDRDKFNGDEEDVPVKIQYSKAGFRFRGFVQVVRMMPKDDIFRMFDDPMSRYISDMNLFDRLTVNKHSDVYRHLDQMEDKYEGLAYFYGYSTSEGRCRILKSNLDKEEFVLERNSFIVTEFKDIDIFLRDYEYTLEQTNQALTKGVKKEEVQMTNTFSVVTDIPEVEKLPDKINRGLVVTFDNGMAHLLINNLSLVKGATFNVIEIKKNGSIAVWGKSLDSMFEYKKGIRNLRITVVKSESIDDFSLVNKSLLNL